MIWKFYLYLLIIHCLLVLNVASISEHYEESDQVKTPCKLLRDISNNRKVPVIRVIDELTGEAPDIILGVGGLRYYILPAISPTDVVIECSSKFGPIDWTYKGPGGATSGFKIVHTKWTSSKDLKISCYSAAIVISNVTDQLTGEYSCTSFLSTDKSYENEFLLFVPQPSAFYHAQGSEINITVPATDTVATLPCISKRRSAAGISLYRKLSQDKLIKLELGHSHEGSLLSYDPFVGFRLKATKELFNQEGNNSIARFICKFDKNLKNFGELKNVTLLSVNLLLRSDEKIAPESSTVGAFSPYFSWTTSQRPELRLLPDLKSQSVIMWQQYFTKNGFEEFSSETSSSKVFHLGSLHLLNFTDGSEGTIQLQGHSDNGTNNLIHKWDYHVFDKTNEDIVGLFYEHFNDDTNTNVFTCISATTTAPKITFKQLFTDEILQTPENDNATDTTTLPTTVVINEDHLITSCSNQSLGCVILTTSIPQGEVTCIGDGVHRTVKYPLAFVEPSRPFFVERGETIIINTELGIIVTLPCLPNSPDVEHSVYLFRKTKEEDFELLWDPSQWHLEQSIEFFPNWGFHIDTSYPESSDPSGTYICTSSSDIQDMSDAVTVIVYRNVTVSPTDSVVKGTLPFSFRWTFGMDADESIGELEILEASSNPNLIVKERSENWAKLTLTKEMEIGDVTNITLVRVQDKSIVHRWEFHKIESEYKSGLEVKVTRNKEIDGETGRNNKIIEATCRGQSNIPPRLNYFFCHNPNSCEIMKRCAKKDCNPSRRYEISSQPIRNNSCKISEGCSRITLKSVPLNGFLKFVCKYNGGVIEERLISDVFFREEILWETKKDSDLIYLFVNNNNIIQTASTDQNPEKEIRNIGSNIDWEIGDTVHFSCAAAPSLFSNGIKWAIETKDGHLVYQDDNVFDPQFKYSGATQVLSTLALTIDSFEIARVWCFVPSLSTDPIVQWSNSSQPIFIRTETDEHCHEGEPSIRLLNIFPPSSKTKDMGINDPRLDNKPYFVVPSETIQFAVKITAPEPVEWFFNGYGAGPTMTPLIQSDRHITDFYDASTYCYTSRLLINLRQKNINDTGRYIAKFKHNTETSLEFYLFVPSSSSPHVIRSGSEVNETWGDLSKSFNLPCLVNNPKIPVELFKKNDTDDNFETFTNDNVTFDPTLGYIFPPNADDPQYLLGTYMCMADGDPEDFIIINVLPLSKKKADLKYEKVGEFHVFTCLSNSDVKPTMSFKENESSEAQFNSTLLVKMDLKDCPDGMKGCSILTTTVPSGIVLCIGDGIHESYKYPINRTMEDTEDISSNGSNNSKKTGLWYNSKENTFKCQTNSEETPKLTAISCRRPNECQVMQSHLREEGDKSQTRVTKCGPGCGQLQMTSKSWPRNWFSVFVRCEGNDSTDILQQYFHDKNRTLLAEREMVEKFQKIRLDVVSFSRQKNFVHGKFRCFANRYFYSRGIQWGLEKNNGAIVIQENIPIEVEVQNFSATMSEIRLELDELKYKAVICFVPLLASSGWANATINIPIDTLVYDF